MNQDEIVEMARQAGFSLTHSGLVKLWLANSKDIESFAKLVADVATAKEREACAKVCEKDDSMRWSGAADAIRARGDNK